MLLRTEGKFEEKLKICCFVVEVSDQDVCMLAKKQLQGKPQLQLVDFTHTHNMGTSLQEERKMK